MQMENVDTELGKKRLEWKEIEVLHRMIILSTFNQFRHPLDSYVI